MQESNKLLTNEDIKSKILTLSKPWEIINEKEIRTDFTFTNFDESISFVNKVATESSSQEHHPEIGVFDNRVEIVLFTRSLGGITDKDFQLAQAIEKIYDEK